MRNVIITVLATIVSFAVLWVGMLLALKYRVNPDAIVSVRTIDTFARFIFYPLAALSCGFVVGSLVKSKLNVVAICSLIPVIAFYVTAEVLAMRLSFFLPCSLAYIAINLVAANATWHGRRILMRKSLSGIKITEA